MPCQSENRALYSIQVIHTQKDSQLMNSASRVKTFTAAEKIAFKIITHSFNTKTKTYF